jgi:hypothetical protein
MKIEVFGSRANFTKKQNDVKLVMMSINILSNMLNPWLYDNIIRI